MSQVQTFLFRENERGLFQVLGAFLYGRGAAIVQPPLRQRSKQQSAMHEDGGLRIIA